MTKSSTPTTLAAGARIQSSTARSGNGTVAQGSHAARAQSAAAPNASGGKAK